MKITSLQVLENGTILVNGIEYTSKEDAPEIDLSYLNSLEQENAYLRDVLADAEISVDDFEESISTQLTELRAILADYSDSKNTQIIIPGAGFSINDLLDDLRNEEDPQPEKIIVRTGTYKEPIDVSGVQDLTFVFEDVEISGLRQAEWDWVLEDNMYVGTWPGYKDLWTWQDDDSRGAYNNTKMYPVIAMIGDEPLMWNPKIGDFGFFIDSEPNEPGKIYVRLKEGQKIDDFVFSPYDRLFYGDENTKNITIEGYVKFKGCSNTGKTGAVNFPGSGWDTTKATIAVSHVNTIGIEFGQGGTRSNMKNHVTDSAFGTLISFMAGQMGFWGMAKDCAINHMEHSFSNWKGFSYWWEASMKLEGWENCTIEYFKASNCQGQGLWFDISNHNNVVNSILVDGCMLAGLMVEHHATGNKFFNIDVQNVSSKVFDPSTSWSVAAGILCQSSVSDNHFGYDPDGNIDGSIFIKNTEDAIRINNEDNRDQNDDGTFNATTTNNIFKNLSYEGVTDPPVRVLGDMAGNQID